MARRRQAEPVADATEPVAPSDGLRDLTIEFCGCGKIRNSIRDQICAEVCPAEQRANGGTYVYRGGQMRWVPD